MAKSAKKCLSLIRVILSGLMQDASGRKIIVGLGAVCGCVEALYLARGSILGLVATFAPVYAQPQPATVEPTRALSTGDQSIWYAADTNFTHCFQSRPPARRIHDLKDNGGEVTTKDLVTAGQIVGVEVSVQESAGLEERYWTYFRSREACEAKIAAENAVPEKYQ